MGGFDVSLGRIGMSLSTGEESDLLLRIREIGGIAVYEPEAVVGHIVPPERLSKKWFLRRRRAGARSNARRLINNGERLSLARALASMLRCFWLLAGVVLMRRGPEVIFLKRCTAAGSVARVAATIKYKLHLRSKV